MYILFSKENKSIQLKMTVLAPASLEQLIVMASVFLREQSCHHGLQFIPVSAQLLTCLFHLFLIPTRIIVNCMCLNTCFDFLLLFFDRIL